MINYKEIETSIEKIISNNNIHPFFKNYIYLTVIGMIKKYGIEYKDLILESISEINFVCGIDNLEQRVNEELLPQVEENLKKNSQAFILYEIRIRNKDTNPQIYLKYHLCYKEITKDKLLNLEFMIHEINHIVCSKINTFFLCEDNSIGYRNGLFTRLLQKESKGEGRTFDETINSLITNEILHIILNLDPQELDNKEIIEFLSKIPEEIKNNYETYGYKNMTTLFKTLYEIEDFNKFITKNLINGNILEIQNEIDKYLGENEYLRMLNLLDELYNKIYNPNQDTHQISLIYSTIREEFINKYINKKYGKPLVG